MPDARVQAAIDHWAPRFVQAGVDYNNFFEPRRPGSSTGRTGTTLGVANADMHAELAEQAAAEGTAAHGGGGMGASDRGAATSPSSCGWSTQS